MKAVDPRVLALKFSRTNMFVASTELSAYIDHYRDLQTSEFQCIRKNWRRICCFGQEDAIVASRYMFLKNVIHEHIVRKVTQ